MRHDSKIIINDYNPAWPSYYIKEEKGLRETLGDLCVDSFHIGSTAVTGLCGKSSIDIAIVVRDTKCACTRLATSEYQYKGEYNIPLRPFFGKKCSKYSVNLHMYPLGHSGLAPQLIFRDYLRNNPEAVQHYGAIKRKAAVMPRATEKMANGIPRYNAYKSEFILYVLDLAGFNSLHACLCGTPTEWEAYYAISKGLSIQGTEGGAIQQQAPDNSHLVLYHGTKIVAAAHVMGISQSKATVYCGETHDRQACAMYSQYLLDMIKSWVRDKGGALATE